MITMNPVPSMDTIDNRSSLVLTIGVKDLSEIVAWMIQSGIRFMIYPTYSSVETREDTHCGLKSPAKEPIEQSVPDKQRLFLETVDRIIREHLLTEKTPTLEEVTKAAGMNGSKIKAQLSELTGKTFYQYYIEKKMDYAAELLRIGYNAKSTSQKIGYTHPIKFNKMFQKQFGITPYQYRKKHKSANVS